MHFFNYEVKTLRVAQTAEQVWCCGSLVPQYDKMCTLKSKPVFFQEAFRRLGGRGGGWSGVVPHEAPCSLLFLHLSWQRS